jgi:putative CocE/NonD family hydrolase
MIEFPVKDGVRFIKNVTIPMTDGVQLAMDLHVPCADDSADWRHTPRPLLLEYIPYRKDDVQPYTGSYNYFAQHGIISARLDCRGSGSSGGINTDEYTPLEQQDGVEAVEWLADQDWCNGKVGMIGSSYGGFTSVQIAAHRPPHLATIIPIYFTDDRYTDDCHYRGGAMRCYYDIGAYGASMIGMNAMPPYPEYSGANWAGIWEEHLDNNTPYLLEWLAHQRDGDYWRPGSIRDRYNQIECPVFMIGGWRDGYPNPPLRTFANLDVPKRLLMGPWNHTLPDRAIPGPRIDYLAEVVRWCDHWLKGEENAVMDEPPVQIYMQTFDPPRTDRTHTSGYWRAEQELPPPVLAADGAYFLGADGSLTTDSPGPGDGFDEYEYCPTVGTAGGLWSGGVPFGLPTDQRLDEIDSVTYTTAPLAQPLEILGWPCVRIFVSSTAPVMAFVTRLSDVAPDGTSALICTGVLNGTRRTSLREPEAMAPGEVYELEFALDATAWRFAPGHQIRLALCSADFPNLWPTPYKGTNRLYRDTAHPSTLSLPLVLIRENDGDGDLPKNEIDFGFGENVAVYALTPDEPPWQIVRDLLGNRVGLQFVRRQMKHINDAMEVTDEAKLDLWACNDRPADVTASGHHHRRIVRQDGIYVVDSGCILHSTETAFHLTIDLHITINDMPHYQRRWVKSFDRQLL